MNDGRLHRRRGTQAQRHRVALYLCAFTTLCLFADNLVIASEQPDLANPRPDRGHSAPAPHQLNPNQKPNSKEGWISHNRTIGAGWQSRISVPQSEKDKKYRSELQHLIAQIRSIKFEPKNQEPKPAIAIEPPPDTRDEARGTKDVHPPSSVAGRDTTEEASTTGGKENDYKPVSSQTLQMLENLSQQPDQPRTNWPTDKGPTRTSDAREFSVQLVRGKAFELAEILFLSGHLKQAAMFYQQALDRKDPNDIASAEVRSWILFQIGNCLWFNFAHHPELVEGRDDDLLTAKKMYRQLITEYPNCPWTDLAKARQNLIDWHLNDKPQTLIAECK